MKNEAPQAANAGGVGAVVITDRKDEKGLFDDLVNNAKKQSIRSSRIC